MGQLTSDRSKVLVEVEGRPILEHNLRAIMAVDPTSEVRVISGYLAPSVELFVAGVSDWANVTVINNPDYKISGPLRSIEIALDSLPALPAAVTIGNGDTIFSPQALASLRSRRSPAVLLASVAESSDEDDVQLMIGPERIEAAAKRLAPPGSLPISAGLFQVLGSNTASELKSAVTNGLEQERKTKQLLTWHSIIARMSEVKPEPLIVPRNYWAEFDSPDNLVRHGMIPIDSASSW
jgi:choline kinase